MNLSTDVDSGIAINLELVAAVLRDQKELHRSRIILASGSEFSIEMPFSEAVVFVAGNRHEGSVEGNPLPGKGEGDDVEQRHSEITPLKCDGINRVYHETMVKALKMEIAELQEVVRGYQEPNP